MTKPNIVIVGGGFGGIYTARYLHSLVKEEKATVTIISKSNHFLFTPLLHEVATGGLSSMSIVEPVREIFRHKDIKFIQDEVTSIDIEAKTVTMGNSVMPYDYLVISSGAETNYYGVPGAKENSFSLKDLHDAQAIRRNLIDSCEKGHLLKDEDEKRKALSCIIVGAGPTGVELAAEIVEFMHETLCYYYHMCGFDKGHMNINLISAGPDILAQFPENLRKIAWKELERKGINILANKQAVEVQPGKVSFKDGTSIEAGTIIWVAGVKPKDMEIANVEKEKNGRIKIDEFLRVVGKNDVFSLGDISGTWPMLAQVAVQQGRTVAQNIQASIENAPLSPFKFKEKGLLVSLGQWYAAGKIFGMTMKGPFMWWLWRTIYLFNFHCLRKRIKIALEWTINIFYPRDITKI